MTALPANRLSGLAVTAFGVLLLAWIIPHHTETASYGWVKPDTLPRICAWALTGLGLVQAALPRGAVSVDGAEMLVVALCAAISAAAIWGLGRAGFAVAAPLFAVALVALIGERRPVWIAATVLGAPLVIWLVVDQLLGRPLP